MNKEIIKDVKEAAVQFALKQLQEPGDHQKIHTMIGIVETIKKNDQTLYEEQIESEVRNFIIRVFENGEDQMHIAIAGNLARMVLSD